MLSLSSFTLVRGVASRCATHLARSRQARYCTGDLDTNGHTQRGGKSTRTHVVTDNKIVRCALASLLSPIGRHQR